MFSEEAFPVPNLLSNKAEQAIEQEIHSTHCLRLGCGAQPGGNLGSQSDVRPKKPAFVLDFSIHRPSAAR